MKPFRFYLGASWLWWIAEELFHTRRFIAMEAGIKEPKDSIITPLASHGTHLQENYYHRQGL